MTRSVRQKLVSLLCFLMLSNTTDAAVPPAKILKWIGWGQAEGSYEEGGYSLKEELIGIDYEYGEFGFQPVSGKGKVDGYFLNKLEFQETMGDPLGNDHKFRFDSLTPHYTKGYAGEWKLTKLNSVIVAVEAFLGAGLISFTKDSGNVSFDRRYGFNIDYGWMATLLYKYDDQIVLGWRRRFHADNIYLEYNEERGKLIHRRSTVFFLGLNLQSNPDCVSTAYVVC